MGISLIITTYNRSILLARSLKRIAQLTKPDEIIVVDDGGDDGCREMCRLTIDRTHLPIRYEWIDHRGETTPCRARNIALDLVSHEQIVVSEPELLFSSDVIGQMRRLRMEYRDDVLHEKECLHQPYIDSHVDELNTVPGFYVNAYMKQWLVDIGGWDENFPGSWAWDDLDLFNRLEYSGHKRRPFEQIRVLHQWHPSRIEPAVENEAYIRAKEFPRDLVANR